MIENITIKNYKSVEKVELDLGRVNVLIGENGAGKSNLLEAIALAGAAQARKLDNEFLASRGIRVSGPELMRSAFNRENANSPIEIAIALRDKSALRFKLSNDNKPYSSWTCDPLYKMGNSDFLTTWIRDLISSPDVDENERQVFLKELTEKLESALGYMLKKDSKADAKEIVDIKLEPPAGMSLPKINNSGGIEDFIIFSPENSSLRTFEREGQIEPLGINGEGLLKLLQVFSKKRNKVELKVVIESLQLLNWFDDLKVGNADNGKTLHIADHFISQQKIRFDQRSVNEGFLFLTFYFALFASKLTPRFFAVDNIDTSLNPRLCEELLRRLTAMANINDKQVIMTTHNPALLDGLDLNDPENRLFIVSRGSAGQTRVRRFSKKPTSKQPKRLSELFLTGALGGLPKGF